ncbi:MAG: matrixin family metalloprotease [Acidobacteria bacterium]|nr:matrixin family metalloprotease [Acidobacteriota bacterium]
MARTSACGTWGAVVMATVALAGFARPVSAAGPAPSPVVTVWIQNEAPAAPGILSVAKSEVTRMYRHAGVKIVWAAATSTAHLFIVIRGDKMAERMNVSAGAMGHAVVLAATGTGRRAYIFLENVERRSDVTGVVTGCVLGHVIAHEIGHLLGLAHSSSGIMREVWDRDDFALARRGLLLFTSAEREMFRGPLFAMGPQ